MTPFIIGYDESKQTYTVDHPKRRHLNVINITYVKAPHLVYENVRRAKPVSRDSFLDRDNDHLFLGETEFQRAEVYRKIGGSEQQRYVRELLKATGLATWVQSVD